MTEREQKNAFATYNRRLEQYAKNLGTNSRQYQHLLHIGQNAGFTLSPKGNYVIASAGRDELNKMNEDIFKSIQSVPTWEKTKQWYQERLNLKGKSKTEQMKEMQAESEFYTNLTELMETIYTEVYNWEKEHQTIDSDYVIETYHENIDDAWHYTREEFNEWIENIRAEMQRGGTERKRMYDEMSGDVYNDLYGVEL